MLREPLSSDGRTRSVRFGLLAAAIVALVAPVGATGDLAWSGKTPENVLGLGRSGRTDFLVRLDGESLRPMSKRLVLGGHASAWAFSPDGKRLAVGVDRALGLRLVDVRRLKRIGRIETLNGNIFRLAWLAPRRIVGVEEIGLFVVDPVAGRRMRSPRIVGDIFGFQQAGSVVALVVAPSGEVGPARLAVVGAEGNIRTVTLEGIRAGATIDQDSMRGESRHPGLAVDPAGRAFVVGALGEPVAEVSLATLAVTYHRPEPRRSLATRLHDWIEAEAEAKMPLVGSRRTAHWLGDGRIAVWGYDSAPVAADRVASAPVGLSIIDTRDWTVETVDARATQVACAAGLLLSVGEGAGLTAYTPEGGRRYHLFGEDNVEVRATFGSRAFVVPGRAPMRVVDVLTGQVVGTRRSVPQLLDAEFSWW
jgi:hypothetical protein